MEALAEEIREDKRKLDNIKFTTIFPYIVNTGLCKKPRIRLVTYSLLKSGYNFFTDYCTLLLYNARYILP